MHGEGSHWVMASIPSSSATTTTATAWVAGARIRALRTTVVRLLTGPEIRAKVRQGLAVCLGEQLCL